MKYKIISLLSLEDALSQGSERLRTLTGIEFLGGSVNDSLISSDKYSVEYAIKHNEELAVLKIFIEPDGERAVEIKNSIGDISNDKVPFFVKTLIINEELIVTDGWGNIFTSDLIIIYDSWSTIVDYIKCSDDICEKPLSDFLLFIKEALLRGEVFDLMSLSAIKYSNESGIVISPVVNLIYRKRNNTQELLAFRNYLLLQFIQITVCYLNCRRECDNWEDAEINIYSNQDSFDLRRVDYYNSPQYVSSVKEAIKVLNSKSKYNFILLDEIFRCDTIALSIGIINKIIEQLPQIDYKSSNVYFIDENRYEIIGSHVENRLSVKRKDDNKIGYINFTGDFVIDFLYDSATDFSEEIAVCSKNGLYGAINREGEVVVEFEYSYLEWDMILNTFFWQKKEERGRFKRCEIKL